MEDNPEVQVSDRRKSTRRISIVGLVRRQRPEVGSDSIAAAQRREGVAGKRNVVARLTGAGKLEVQF